MTIASSDAPRNGGGVSDGGERDVTKSMMRKLWTTRLLCGLMAWASAGGCKQQLFVEPGDYKGVTKAGLERLEERPHDPIAPSLIESGLNLPTVLNPNLPPKPMTLKECISLALEQGNVGSQGGLQNAGFTNDNLPQFTGRNVAGSDTIKVLVLDPAIVGADIERALSKFDARWITSMTWSKNDTATVNFQQAFNNGDTASFTSTLAKPLPTGGVAGITFGTDYRRFTASAQQQFALQLTTQYTPRVQFLFEQPLLQSFGVEINQLATSHPGSLLVQGLRPSGGQTTEGILITRIRYEQQRAEFDRQVNNLLLNVEFAYWNLYASYYNLYAQEYTLTQSFDLYTVVRDRVAAGTNRKQELTQILSQYFLFRQQALSARHQVQNSERQLRGLLGMTSFSDGMRIVPVDEPTLSPFIPDFGSSANEALANRPELILARHDLKFRQLDILLQKNQRRPDLRFFSSYDIQGIGSELDGSAEFRDPARGPNAAPIPQNAFANLAQNNFNSWQLGLRLDMPLGFRDANAAVHQARLNLVRSYTQLQDSERKSLEVVSQQVREVINQQSQIDLLRQRRIYLQETLDLNKVLVDKGAFEFNTLFNILQVQRDVAGAIASEFQAVAQYNSSIAGLEFAKGTIQRFNNVSVGDGPLPGHVQKRAADHFSARNIAIKLREQPAELPLQSLTKPWQSPVDTLPEMPGAPGQNAPNPLPFNATPSSPMPSAVPKMAPATPPLTSVSPSQNLNPTTVRQWPGTATSEPVMFQEPKPVFVQTGTVQLPTRRVIAGTSSENGTPVSVVPPR